MGGISQIFVERPHVIRAIEESLDSSEAKSSRCAGLRIAVIQSLAGSGKSQIARSFAEHWLVEHSALHWFDASNTNTLNQSFQDFARDVGIVSGATSINNDATWIRRKVCGWIMACEEEWLLIFDNYDIMNLKEGDEYDIAAYFPLSAKGRILITSRNREVQSLIGGALLDIGQMTDDEATELFAKHAQIGTLLDSPDERDALREIACDLLGSYPLAIAQGASYFRHGFQASAPLLVRLQRYRQQYFSHEEAVLHAATGLKVRDYGRSVLATLEMSFELIAANNRAAAELLLLFGFFHHNNITDEIFSRAFVRRDHLLPDDGIDISGSFAWLGTVLAPDLEGQWDRHFDFDVALNLLANYSLIQRTGDGAWNVHPLVHRWTVFSKQYPGLSTIEDRARIALALLGQFYDYSADTASYEVWQIKLRNSVHANSAVNTVMRGTKLLDLYSSSTSVVKARTLVRLNHMFFGESTQTPQENASRLGSRLILQALANGSVQDGLEHISSLQSLKAALIDLNDFVAILPEGAHEVMAVPIYLLPMVAEKDSEVELHTQHLTFQLTLINMLKKSGQYGRAVDLVEACLVYTEQFELDLDPAFRLRVRGSAFSTLSGPPSNPGQSRDTKLKILSR